METVSKKKSYDVCEERVSLDLVFWDDEATDEFVGVQVENGDGVGCPLLRRPEDISQATVHDPKAITFVHANTECTNDSCVVLLQNIVFLFGGFGVGSSMPVRGLACNCLSGLGQ